MLLIQILAVLGGFAEDEETWIFSDDDEALSHLQVALQPADAVIVSPVNLGGANTGLVLPIRFRVVGAFNHSLVVGDAQARIHHGVINKIAQLRRVLPGCNHQVQHAEIFVFALLGHGHFKQS